MSGYFLYHSIGTFPGKAEAMGKALADFSTIWSACDDGQWPAALGQRQKFIDSWCALIDAPKGTLTTAENVTTALYSFIGGLPRHMLEGKRILVAADCFPSLHFLLAGMADKYGFTLDTVPLRDGETYVRDDDFIAHWREDVALALLTFVTSTTSHRADVRRLATHGKAVGSLVGVDITQGVGVAPFSLNEVSADFVVSSSLKWLCGASGAGILQVAPDLIGKLQPELRGWFSQDNPFRWDLDAFAYAADARRFDHGTPSILASIASQPGLDWVTATGIDNIAAQNRVLTEKIIAHIDDHGWALASPRAADQRGGSVMMTLPNTADAAAITAHLRQQQLYCDARGQTLRLSPGFVTANEAVDELFKQLENMLPNTK